MDYSAADVKKLREETGAGFSDCKTALTEAKSWGDAIKYLEERSGHKAAKMMAALWRVAMRFVTWPTTWPCRLRALHPLT